MSAQTTCAECEEMGPGVAWKDNDGRACVVCEKVKPSVLDLHHTRAVLCSLECEQSYWLDIVG